MQTGTLLTRLYHRLLEAYGPQHWWPATGGPLEVIVGAVLTQNTNWGNVERAVANLKQAGALDLETLDTMAPEALAALIRPAGYYNVKARRLKALAAFLRRRCGGDLEAFFSAGTDELRRQLLEVKGVGPETADSILLYAGAKPVFVVDAYTFRITARHGLVDTGCTYDELQELFMDHLAADAGLYNEYHALLVRLGKERCRKRRPACAGCPAREVLGEPDPERA